MTIAATLAGRHRHAGELRRPVRRRPRRERPAAGQPDRRHRRDDPGAARRHRWCRWRSAAAASTRPTAWARRSPASRCGSPRRWRKLHAGTQAIPNAGGRGQSGDGASLHRQPAVGRRHGAACSRPIRRWRSASRASQAMAGAGAGITWCVRRQPGRCRPTPAVRPRPGRIALVGLQAWRQSRRICRRDRRRGCAGRAW